jgi:hypothetical protein
MLVASAWPANGQSNPALSPPPSPTPSPAPSSSLSSLALGSLTVDGVATGYVVRSDNVNAIGALDTPGGSDRATRSDLTNALLIVTKGTGTLRYGFAAGVYNIPVAGFALNATTRDGANTSLYGALPSWYVTYAPGGAFRLEVGALATLTGQENTYTYENANIQRGVVWNMENAVSRGLRATWTGSKFAAALGIDDGFFSGNRFGLDGEVANTPNARTTFTLAWVISNASAPPNPTASIANKRLLNPMLTYTVGRWTFSPYLLIVASPARPALGYTSTEHAFGAVWNTTYVADAAWSLPLRIEYAANGSRAGDASLNANLLGYGPGSKAWTYTLTPTYHRGIFVARAEASFVRISGFSPQAGFGPNGTSATQTRALVETGILF